MLQWLSRCVPGICTILLVVLLSYAFGDIEHCPPWLATRPAYRSRCTPYELKKSDPPPKLKTSQLIFIVYTIIVHVDTLAFALRLCLSFVLVNSRIKACLQRRHDEPNTRCYAEAYDDCPQTFGLSRTNSPDLLLNGVPKRLSRTPSPDLLVPKADQPIETGEVIHAIIIPNYGEEVDTLKMTLAVLASHRRARTQYEVMHAALCNFIQLS
jgi:hypothetical protein